MSYRFCRALFTLLFTCLLSTTSLAANHFTVLLYHHVDASTPPSTSVSPEQFEQHLNYLSEQGFTVLDLQVALQRVQQGNSLPDRSVVITFDDAYRSIYENAFPLLKARHFPFTVFVATDPVDRGFKRMMTWSMMREMQKQGGRFANHTRDHAYLVRTDTSAENWLSDTLANIEHAQKRLKDELGLVPNWIAYPYGEYNLKLRDALAERGWIAFGQQSGAIDAGSDFQALPRFPSAGIYANLKTLAIKLQSAPLPVNYTAFPDPVVTSNNPPELMVELTDTLPGNFQLNCFADGDAVRAEWLDQTHFRVQAAEPFGTGRHRYNCTYPQTNGKDFYWMSHQWLVFD